MKKKQSLEWPNEANRPALRGLSIFLRPLFNIVNILFKFPIPLHFVKNYRAALKRALEFLFHRRQQTVQVSLEKLLDLMGRISWEREGVDFNPSAISSSDPLKPVFDSLCVLKQDFDTILKGKKSIEEKLLLEKENADNANNSKNNFSQT